MNLKTSKVTLKAFAKLNLFLNITGVLPSGYHSLETVMQSIDLADIVSVEIGGSAIKISCDNPHVPCNEKNIAYRASKAFMNAYGKNFGVKVAIEKHIPLEAGMGGSSADGAAVLLALNKMLGEPFETKELLKIGSALGADVPFCLTGGTRICKGIGDEFFETPVLPDCVFLIIKPDFANNTSKAYRLYDEKRIKSAHCFETFTDELKKGDIHSISSELYNVFTQLYADERIAAIKDALIENGALNAEMTGSGSAVFGIFDNEQKAQNAQNGISFPMKYLSKPISALEIAEHLW